MPSCLTEPTIGGSRSKAPFGVIRGLVDTCLSGAFDRFRGDRGTVASRLKGLGWQIQNALRPPPDGYRLRAAIGEAVRVGGEAPQTYVNGTIRGNRLVLRRFDDREAQLAQLVRPKIVGAIEPASTGSVLRYRVRFRPFVWIIPLSLVLIGIGGLVAGIHAMSHSSSDGWKAAMYVGLVLTVAAIIGAIAMAYEARDYAAALEAWLSDPAAHSENPVEGVNPDAQ